jgi:hypothetical protein
MPSLPTPLPQPGSRRWTRALLLAALCTMVGLAGFAESPVGRRGCTSDSQCTGGKKCCYPCGIPGCAFTCVTPMNGRCPLIP